MVRGMASYLFVPYAGLYADFLQVSWRLPIEESGVLDFFLSILPEDGLRQSLRIQTLRVIGNSCADTGMRTKSNTGSHC